jgi:hypothetical protein
LVVQVDGVGLLVVRLGVGDAEVGEGVGDADADRLADGEADADRLGDGDWLAPLQTPPLMVNAVGLLKVPLQVPWKPNCVEAPVPSGAFHDMFVAVIAVPEAVQFADQPLLKV